MSEGPGLRERKKAETRRVLSEVATRLFAEQGFDAVRTADVAAAANVSEKTVFNYFATKEDLVLEGRKEVEAELVRAVRERARGESVLDVVRQHTLATAERMNALPAWRRAAFRKIVQTAPTVHARMRQLSLEHEEELAAVLGEGLRPGDVRPRVVASVVGVLTRLAFGLGTDPEDKRRTHRDVVEGIEAAFALVGEGLADFGRRKK